MRRLSLRIPLFLLLVSPFWFCSQSSLARLSKEDAKHTYSCCLPHSINSDWERGMRGTPALALLREMMLGVLIGSPPPCPLNAEKQNLPCLICTYTLHANWDMIKGCLIFLFFIHKFLNMLSEKIYWMILGT